MGDFASVFDEAGDSAEQAEATRAMAMAKQASVGIKGFLFQATGEDDFGHRVAMAEDDLLKAAAAGGISVHALVADITAEFDLLMEARRAQAGMPGMPGVPGAAPQHAPLPAPMKVQHDMPGVPDSPLFERQHAPLPKPVKVPHDMPGVSDGMPGIERQPAPLPKPVKVPHDMPGVPDGLPGVEKTSATKPVPCTTCNGARSIPAQGHESYHEVHNGQVRCPGCAGHGVQQADDSVDTDDRTAYERFGDSGPAYSDAGDEQDAWYRDASKHVASIRTALEEGQDPLAWLEQEGAGEGQAEKPSEAGIEALRGAEAATRPF